MDQCEYQGNICYGGFWGRVTICVHINGLFWMSSFAEEQQNFWTVVHGSETERTPPPKTHHRNRLVIKHGFTGGK